MTQNSETQEPRGDPEPEGSGARIIALPGRSVRAPAQPHLPGGTVLFH